MNCATHTITSVSQGLNVRLLDSVGVVAAGVGEATGGPFRQGGLEGPFSLTQADRRVRMGADPIGSGTEVVCANPSQGGGVSQRLYGAPRRRPPTTSAVSHRLYTERCREQCAATRPDPTLPSLLLLLLLRARSL